MNHRVAALSPLRVSRAADLFRRVAGELRTGIVQCAALLASTTSMHDDASDDVPSPIDLRAMVDAREWAAAVMARRPWREDFFGAIADQLRPMNRGSLSVLELGSGPGFLAQQLLTALNPSRYAALDFSDAMHALARERLGTLAASRQCLAC